MTPIATFRQGRIVYPDSDGKRMAENTLQYDWIVAIHAGLEFLFRNHADVFVAADNLIYPVQGNPRVCVAPDVYVAFGRPKGHRGSYKVWEEDGIFPQVAIEVWSPGNTLTEMIDKRTFFDRYGAEEFHLIDPENGQAEVWVRRGGGWPRWRTSGRSSAHDWASGMNRLGTPSASSGRTASGS